MVVVLLTPVGKVVAAVVEKKTRGEDHEKVLSAGFIAGKEKPTGQVQGEVFREQYRHVLAEKLL